MSIAVLCIDRDDDIGRKTGMKTPIIGRENNLEVAEKLGLADPEESDLNAIYESVRLYDELRGSGKDVEVITLSGDQEVGYVSDEIIKNQLEDTLDEYGFDSVILVSDGAEDEFILPIVESRVKVDSIRRVVIKQSKNIESAYYLLKEVFSNPNVSKRFLAPIGLVFLMYGVALFIGAQRGVVATILTVLAAYILIVSLGWGDPVERFAGSVKESLLEGRASFIMYIVGIMLVVIGIIQGITGCLGVTGGYLTAIMLFINESVWWFVVASIFLIIGSILDSYLKGGMYGRKLVFPFFTLATGIILWGTSSYVISLEYSTGGIRNLLFSMIGGVLMAGVGIWITKRLPVRARL
jgi:Predicted membrane protein